MRFNGILSHTKSHRAARLESAPYRRSRGDAPYLRVSVPPCETYKLYGLADDEIAVVEKAVKK